MEEIILGADFRENCTKGIVGAITFKDKWAVGVGNLQYWCSGECGFKFFKSFLTLIRPNVRSVLLCESVKRARDLRELVNESAIKISKPNEALKFGDVTWGRPISNGFDFCWVHPEAVA